MNILPKKRWHVRTRDNVIRVRRDEKKAEEEAKALEARQKLAEQEARTRYLRMKASERLESLDPFARSQPSTSRDAGKEEGEGEKSETGTLEQATDIHDEKGHLNFFAELERKERTFGGNKEAQAEEKKEYNEWEKKVGILKQLADGATESLGKEQPWWNKPREKLEPVSKKPRLANSVKPINNSQQMLFPSDLDQSHISHIKLRKKKKESSKKRKKGKKRRRRSPSPSSSSSSSQSEEDSKARSSSRSKLEVLRVERRRREAAEAARTNALLRKLNGEPEEEEKGVMELKKEETKRPRKQLYSEQFHPEFARQNRLD